MQLRGGGGQKDPILCRIKKGGIHFEAICVAGDPPHLRCDITAYERA